MKEDLTEDEVRELQNATNYALGMMSRLKAQHPSAKITFNIGTKWVSVTYPALKDAKGTSRFLD